MALSPQQARFVAEYCVDMNATQAAIRAGYSEATAKQQGSRLLTRVDVKAALVDMEQAVVAEVQHRVSSAVADAAWIIQKAVEVVDIGLASAPVRGRDGKVIMVENEDGESVPAGYEAYNLTAVNGALALLSKRLPEFSEKHEVTGDVRLRVEALAAIATMTPEQLREVAAGARNG